MIKILIAFIVFAALALYILARSGGDIDLGGEKHSVEAPTAASPANPAGSAPAAQSVAAPAAQAAAASAPASASQAAAPASAASQ